MACAGADEAPLARGAVLRTTSAPGAGERGRRRTLPGRRPSSPAGSCAARASLRGAGSRGPRGRRRRHPPPPRWMRTCSGSRPRHGATWSRSTCSHCVATYTSIPPSPSGTASPDSGPRNAWSWMPDLVHPGHRHVTVARRDRRAGSRSCVRRWRGRRRGSRDPSSAGRGGAAASPSPAPCRRPARAPRTRRWIASAARRACSGCSAATSATGSPK